MFFSFETVISNLVDLYNSALFQWAELDFYLKPVKPFINNLVGLYDSALFQLAELNFYTLFLELLKKLSIKLILFLFFLFLNKKRINFLLSPNFYKIDLKQKFT